jgi:hypothetical protein
MALVTGAGRRSCTGEAIGSMFEDALELLRNESSTGLDVGAGAGLKGAFGS